MTPAREIEVATHAVLRVAAWPVEAADGFGSASLAAAARALHDEVEARRAAGAALAEAVFAAVPLAAPDERRWLIKVRRTLHAGADPFPAPPGVPIADADHAGGDDSLSERPTDLLLELLVELDARERLAAQRTAFGAMVDATMRDELVALRRAAGTPAFRIALGLANAAVADKWDRLLDRPGEPIVEPKARVRRLEGTVLHYFLRACGRPTPHGTFAGIVPVVPAAAGVAGDGRVRVEPAEPAVRVEPDLEPFVEVLARWRSELASWPDHELQRNPTLHTASGQHLWHPLGSPDWVAGVVPPALAPVLDAWPAGTVRRRGAVEGEVSTALVDAALAAGLLESTIVLDPDATDVWTALEAVAPRLPDARRELWTGVIDEARAQCAALADAIAADDVAATRAGSTALVAIVARLGSSTPGVPRVDRRLPWRATWDADARHGAADAMRRVHWLHHHDGAAEAYRRARLADLVGDAPDSPSPSLLHLAATRATAAAPTVPGAIRADALARVGVLDGTETRWSSLLETAGDGRPLALAVRAGRGMPAGAGELGTTVLTPSGPTWWYRWGRPQPGMLQTRFASLVQDDAGAELHRVQRAAGAAVVVGAAHPNPTVAVHRRLDEGTVGRLGRAAGALADDAMRVHLGDGQVAIGPAGERRAPVYDSVAAVATTDPLGRYLGALAMAQGWELLVYGAPPIVARELDGGSAPRVVLVDATDEAASGVSTVSAAEPEATDRRGTVTSPRRWVISVVELEQLRSVRGADQFLAWRTLADHRAIDDVVLVRWSPTPGSAEYLFPTTSPLAVRSLLDHLGEGEGPVVASELPGAPGDWPVHGRDGHHLSELAVTWWCATDPGSASNDPS